MNSIHDNQEIIEKEKQDQHKKEECAAEVTDATKIATEIQAGLEPFEKKAEEPKQVIVAAEEWKEEIEKIAPPISGESPAEQLLKLQKENDELKKFISENSLKDQATISDKGTAEQAYHE